MNVSPFSLTENLTGCYQVFHLLLQCRAGARTSLRGAASLEYSRLCSSACGAESSTVVLQPLVFGPFVTESPRTCAGGLPVQRAYTRVLVTRTGFGLAQVTLPCKRAQRHHFPAFPADTTRATTRGGRRPTARCTFPRVLVAALCTKGVMKSSALTTGEASAAYSLYNLLCLELKP